MTGFVLVLLLGSWTATDAKQSVIPLNPSETELQQLMEQTPFQGTLVPLSGPSTEGRAVRIGGREIRLPRGYFVKNYITSIECVSIETCTRGPVIVIGRGQSERWYELRTGRVVLTKVVPGEGEFPDIVPIGSYDNNPVPNISDYLGENWDDQTSNPGIENWINWYVVIGESIKYYVTASELVTDANTAASRWNTALGYNVFTPVSTATEANLTIHAVALTTAYGWADITHLWEATGRNANYLARAKISIDVTRSSSGWARTLTHEFGHILGLGEQYSLTGSTLTCNTAKPSVMWSSDCSGAPTSPTSNDTSNVNTAYKNGTIGNPSGTASGSNYTFTWSDQSWGENYVELMFDREFSPGSWATVGRVAHTTNIGLRSTATWNTLSTTRTFSRLTYGQAAGTYRVCARTQHSLLGLWYQGLTKCGPALVLS